MNKVILGKTKIEVTEICFGCLPFGPLQKNLTPEDAAEVLTYGLDLGINFLDTAQAYKTYEPIKIALSNRKNRPIIATKSAAESYEDMEFAINEALSKMGIEYIDIFHLHAARAGADTLEKRKGAIDCLLDYKSKGIIKAIGVSTHNVKLVETLAKTEYIDIVFPLINIVGRGILQGSVKDMKNAISLCEQNGKGIYLMKALGGGTLIDDYENAMEYARNLSKNYSIAVGMISKEEVTFNVNYFNGIKDFKKIREIKNEKNVIVFQSQCISCGKCMETCHSDAISYNEDNKAEIDKLKCLQCGYCVATCPRFAIRVI
ncbi:MAG: aldo/keto reductase [Bacillota bacterium]|nr:aldo/keto reductase [Bacillota bacterium]